MSRKKVLFLTPWYPTALSPYYGNFVREHAKAVQLYDDVIVLHLAGSNPHLNSFWAMEEETDPTLTEGIRIFRLFIRPSAIPKISFFIQIRAMWAAFRQLEDVGFRPVIIHAHTYGVAFAAAFLSKISQIPVVMTEHSTIYSRRLLGSLDSLLLRLALWRISRVLTVSRSLRAGMEVLGLRATFEIVPNVVDTQLFHETGSTGSNKADHILIVCLLDRSEKKGVETLMKALAQLAKIRDGWHLDHLGEGPALEKYQRLSEELGIADRITFHGAKSKAQVAEFMRNASMLVVPSVYETFSLVTAEAMASGLPVLATRCGGPEELISDDTGMLVPVSDPAALCCGIQAMLEKLDQFDRQSMSASARNRFSPENVGGQIHNIYDRVLDSAGI
jgi:glycosyltransferase involved in cell wall biosynthesis